MRNLVKQEEPELLKENAGNWLEEYLADKANGTKRYRYRDKEIKAALVIEASGKCVYCESKIGHNTPGDVEHKIPTSKNENLHFTWRNLTIACTECKRRKNAYYDPNAPFVDPYVDDVESMVIHHGPIVTWKAGDTRAEISIRILELDSQARLPLILRKIEKIQETMNLIERYKSATNLVLKGLLKKSLIELADKSSEYSAMVLSVQQHMGI